ncbi:hypothetical protein [uncultured Shewanella sp.]|uniref:hypothetical protein n=1 Tax=uncultured Shewanella sp. TaxID=173975 RepID=UPI0026119576|nr:hypothetical protein [uncultured Shewanella sp.]
MKKTLIAGALALVSTQVFSASVSTTTTVNTLYTYGEGSSRHNDIVIKVDSPLTGCEAGFWVKSTDNIGNKNVSAFLLSAFHAGSKMYIAAYNDQLWSGSDGNYCKVHSIGLVK